MSIDNDYFEELIEQKAALMYSENEVSKNAFIDGCKYIRGVEYVGSLKRFLMEEFLIGTQNYPKEYKDLFLEKYNRAAGRHKEYLKNNKKI